MLHLPWLSNRRGLLVSAMAWSFELVSCCFGSISLGVSRLIFASVYILRGWEYRDPLCGMFLARISNCRMYVLELQKPYPGICVQCFFSIILDCILVFAILVFTLEKYRALLCMSRTASCKDRLPQTVQNLPCVLNATPGHRAEKSFAMLSSWVTSFDFTQKVW